MSTSKYIVGQVANLVAGHSKVSDDSENKRKLAALFSISNAKKKDPVPDSDTVKTGKKRKIKLKDDHQPTTLSSVPSKQLSDNTKGYCPPPGIVHESVVGQQGRQGSKNKKRKLEGKDEDVPSGQDPPRKRRKRRDKTKDARTVFVGNLPLNFTKKKVKLLFKECGKIENLRFRCAPASDPSMRKKAIVIKRLYHSERHNIVCYVCFEDEAAAQKAVALNGQVVDGLHLRVDLSSSSKTHDPSYSIFIGNLPFAVEEESLWTFFEQCGEVDNVRLIRDNKTSIGKGFGYVSFKSKDAVGLALRLNGQNVSGRPVRIMRCTDQSKTTKKSKTPAKSAGLESKKHIQFRPSNKPSSFRGMMAEKVAKKKKFKKSKHKVADIDSVLRDGKPKKKRKSNADSREKVQQTLPGATKAKSPNQTRKQSAKVKNPVSKKKKSGKESVKKDKKYKTKT